MADERARWTRTRASCGDRKGRPQEPSRWSSRRRGRGKCGPGAESDAQGGPCRCVFSTPHCTYAHALELLLLRDSLVVFALFAVRCVRASSPSPPHNGWLLFIPCLFRSISSMMNDHTRASHLTNPLGVLCRLGENRC